MMNEADPFENAIAIIGMAGRFPKANSLEEFWQKLQDGEELISFFSDAELLAEGIDEAALQAPNYVKARSVLEHIDLFDAPFFGYSPREAEIIDPQQRLFLMCAWEALERAGYTPETYAGRIGVFGGMGMPTYMPFNLFTNQKFMESADIFQVALGNDKDFLTTRVSYKLNLKGPSINVQTACSTSLVAVHLACQSLLNGECDMAMAGGVSAGVQQKVGYFYQEGSIVSPDGHCRTFDARAQGTVPGSGAGIVVLKRMHDALADGDMLYAVIKGSAINNDGAAKVGYTAPSVDGQAEVIAEALDMANVDARTVSYIEAHGTATPLGDPIEVAALMQAFAGRTQARGFCALGSVKSNLGHLDSAAGVTGLIKTALALKDHVIPPSLHFEQPNASIDFANSPFYVNTRSTAWPSGTTPRHAGVSSFGIGGTNAHVILEEAPARDEADGPATSRPACQLLVLSARTSSALETVCDHLVQHLQQHPGSNMADVAYTYQVGRKAFAHRRILITSGSDDAIQALSTRDPQRIYTQVQERHNRPVVYMFPGQGTQYVNMTKTLYQDEPLFRQSIDSCAEILLPLLQLDIRTLLYPAAGQEENASAQLDQTYITQPALFVVEYALARLWMAWGVQPQAMIGHSIGEYVAACLANVFSVTDALTLVAVRGRLMQNMQPGSMLSVPLAADTLQPLLSQKLTIAAINAPALCVVAGPRDEIEALQKELASQHIDARLLRTSHAFHSAMMEPIMESFSEHVRNIALHAPNMPYISNVTGTWITAAEATSPQYWAKHTRQTIRFVEGMQTVLQDSECVLLEVGPGRTLSTLARQCMSKGSTYPVLTSVRHPQEALSDSVFLQTTLGKLWLAGVAINWQGVHQDERRFRVLLPTYPFELKRYWIEAQGRTYIGSGQNGRKQSAEHSEPQIQQEVTDASAVAAEGAHPATASYYERPDLQTAYVAASNELEQQLAGIWQDLLGIEPIGIHDNFFELGGHSLMATQLLSQLRGTFPVEIPLRTIFEAPTIAQLAEAIETLLIEMLEALPEDEALSLEEAESSV